MACGLPVLQKYDPINADQIIEGVNGFVFRDADELRQKLKAWQALTPELKAAFSESTRQSVANHSYEALANNLLEVYAEAVEVHKLTPHRSLPLKLTRQLKSAAARIYKRPKIFDKRKD